MNSLDSDPESLTTKLILIDILSKMVRPFRKFLSLLTNLVFKITRNKDVEEKVSEEEIKSLISQSQQDGCIENYEKQMIYDVLAFNDKTAREIMTPRNDMFAIDIEDNIEDILEEVLNSSYSRIPVYKGSIDNIIGILYIKDLLIEAKKVGFKNINISDILHDPYFVPENKRANELFKILKAKKVHLALLFDEYGGVVGIVSLEDLIEEIMGDIEDEYDTKAPLIQQIDENNFIVKGYLTINEFNKKFDIEIEQGEYDTINGYLLTLLGKIPKEGKELTLKNVKFTINKVSHRRIEDISVNL